MPREAGDIELEIWENSESWMQRAWVDFLESPIHNASRVRGHHGRPLSTE